MLQKVITSYLNYSSYYTSVMQNFKRCYTKLQTVLEKTTLNYRHWVKKVEDSMYMQIANYYAYSYVLGYVASLKFVYLIEFVL